MKLSLLVAALAAVAVTTPALAADAGVSSSIGQPGFYGRLDISNFPPPQVIYRQPIVIGQAKMDRPPVYLRVPPGHAKHWKKHCREYNACNERVFFVQDKWYHREYVPLYQKQHRDRRYKGRDVHRDDILESKNNNGNDRGLRRDRD